jgi:hypothetical protein
LSLEPFEEASAPLVEVDDQGTQPTRMKADPQDVDRRPEQLRVDIGCLGQRLDRRVGSDQVPGAVYATAG